ncbi:hypothetical protein ACB092_11G156700 [Castanea dentata]
MCNSTNLSLPFNLMTHYFDTSPIQAGNPCPHYCFHFSFPNLNFTPLSHFNQVSPSLSQALHSLNPNCASTTLSTSTV